MIGGEVLGTIRQEKEFRVFCAERKYRKGKFHKLDLHNVGYVWVKDKDRTGRPVNIMTGDSLWWQGSNAIWTPKKVRDTGIGQCDIEIERTSGSMGVSGITIRGIGSGCDGIDFRVALCPDRLTALIQFQADEKCWTRSREFYKDITKHIKDQNENDALD